MKHDKLPQDWNVYEFPSTIEVYDGSGKLIHGEGKPYRPDPDFTIDRVVERALDPCLRSGAVDLTSLHSLNGWQLHY